MMNKNFNCRCGCGFDAQDLIKDVVDRIALSLNGEVLVTSGARCMRHHENIYKRLASQ